MTKDDTPARRLLRVLDLLIEVEADSLRRARGVTVQQAAEAIGVSRSAANRMMRELLAAHYAIANPAGRGYRLGPAVQVHQGLTVEQRRLSELAHPHLVGLVKATGECAHTAIAHGETVLVIDDVETGHALRVVAGSGRRVPLHCTSAGKALIAFGAASLPAELPARTTRTITDAAVMRAHLDTIVELGYAFDDEENDIGVRCISAPVFSDTNGPAIGCVGIDGPSVRIDGDNVAELAAHVVLAAETLTRQLTSGEATSRRAS